MAKNDFQYGGWNYYTLQCGTITTLISSSDCTLQCGMWLWNRDTEFTNCFPWRRPCDYHPICSMDGKTIQCLPNPSQHVSIYLQ